MSETATAESSTTTAEQAAEKLFPTEEQKTAEAKAATDKAAADKAAADQATADKAKADAEAASKAKEEADKETKSPTEEEKAAAEKARLASQADYVLKLPENSALTPDDLAATLKEAKDAGLSKEKAEAMLASKDQVAKAAQTRLQQTQEAAFKQTQVKWKEDVEKDPVIGGEKLNETYSLSSRAVKAVFAPEMVKWLETTGLGGYPDFVRGMAKIGKLIGEDRLIKGNIDEPPAKKPPEAQLYGKTTPGADGKMSA